MDRRTDAAGAKRASEHFCIRRYRLDGKLDYTPISEEVFRQIVDIRRAGQALLYIEETFEVVLGSRR